jgi:hypothetical protein
MTRKQIDCGRCRHHSGGDYGDDFNSATPDYCTKPNGDKLEKYPQGSCPEAQGKLFSVWEINCVLKSNNSTRINLDEVSGAIKKVEKLLRKASYCSSCSDEMVAESAIAYVLQMRSLLAPDDDKQTKLMSEAYLNFYDPGFIKKLMSESKIKKSDRKKECDGIEYEMKFDLSLSYKNRAAEPSLADILDAFDFDFTTTTSIRFMKDAVHDISEEINHFYGTATEPKLVVIEKQGHFYLKEKSVPLELMVDVPYKEIVMKREEKRYEADFTAVQDKIAEVMREAGIKYAGKIRKEKAEDFILDIKDGRFYSFALTRAHLVKPGEKAESAVQRQLEIEYAGFIPGFAAFHKNSEEEIITGLVDVATYCSVLYNGKKTMDGFTLSIKPTLERKFDFVKGDAKVPEIKCTLPEGLPKGVLDI